MVQAPPVYHLMLPDRIIIHTIILYLFTSTIPFMITVAEREHKPAHHAPPL